MLADIGGTHTRCGIADNGSAPKKLRTYHNRAFKEPGALMKHYLAEVGGVVPHTLTAAVAGPVGGETVSLTNLNWVLDATQLQNQVGAERVEFVNDFAALAYAIPVLGADDRVQMGGERPISGAAAVAMGPGTGLGVAGLVRCEDRWLAINSEGGHTTLPAVNPREADIIARLNRRFGHVSAERVLSGPGLVSLYATVTDTSSTARAPAEITDLAIKGDVRARETLDLFFAMLGTVAGNIALTFCAAGGVYLGGGILPKLRARLVQSGFRQRFEAKGRFAEYLGRIPVFLITAESPTLLGLNYYVSQQRSAH